MFQASIDFITRDKMAKDYKDGLTGMEIAAKYGCSYSSAYRILREAGVTPVRQGFDGELADALRKEYEAGDTTSGLANKYNISAEKVCRYIREAGGTIRPRRSAVSV